MVLAAQTFSEAVAVILRLERVVAAVRDSETQRESEDAEASMPTE